MKAFAKIVVANAQIVCSFAPVLNIRMPPIFSAFLGILGVFNFDLSLTIGFGCLSDGAYATSLATSFGLVAAVVILVGMDYLYAIRKVRREAGGAAADMSGTIRSVFDSFDADASGTLDVGLLSFSLSNLVYIWKIHIQKQKTGTNERLPSSVHRPRGGGVRALATVGGGGGGARALLPAHITRTAHSEALIVRGAGYDVDHLHQPRAGLAFSAHLH